jgi:hypothetical protein
MVWMILIVSQDEAMRRQIEGLDLNECPTMREWRWERNSIPLAVKTRSPGVDPAPW